MTVQLRSDSRFVVAEAVGGSILLGVIVLTVPPPARPVVAVLWLAWTGFFALLAMRSRRVTYIEITEESVCWPGHAVDRRQVASVSHSDSIVEFLLGSGERVVLDLSSLKPSDRVRALDLLAPLQAAV